jgi:hypothetical protein
VKILLKRISINIKIRARAHSGLCSPEEDSGNEVGVTVMKVVVVAVAKIYILPQHKHCH